ncbi:PITH domain-containing protein 1, partial [Coemansia sp. RSA 486]
MNCHDEAGDDDYHAGHSHGHGHHDHSHDHSHDAAADTGFSDSLFSKVNIDLVRCLNESTPDAIKQVFKPYHRRLDTTQFVSSDPDDPELLVYVPFTAMIKL